MNMQAVVLLVLLGVGVAVTAMKWQGDAGTAPVMNPGADSAVLALELRLHELEQRHEVATQRLAELETWFAASKLGLDDPVAAEEVGVSAAVLAAPVEARPVVTQPGGRGGDETQRIAESGLTQEEYGAMETMAYDMYLQGIESDWERRREAWLANQRPPSVDERMRENLGDDAYDRYLFASGRSNRVRLRQVFPGSEAAAAGLRPGDVILSYDGRRVFNFEDLRTLSYDGEVGETVMLEVRNEDGNVSQVVMPRGPMGLSGYRGWREAPGS